MPKVKITKAAIGRVLDAVIPRQDQFGRLEIRPDGTVVIYPKQANNVDKHPASPRLKEWKG
jgi:hypothetical protein